jgi:hypothetical protein
MLGEGRFGEFLARDGRRAHVEHKRNAGLAPRRDEGGHAALIANGKDRVLSLSYFSLSLLDLPGKSGKHRISAKGEGAFYWMPAFLSSPKRSLITSGLK